MLYVLGRVNTFIYDKSQLENISKEQIFELLKKAGLV